MQTSYIKTALKVAETGSITKAAEALFMRQPSASGEISRLEKELGFALFIRTRSKSRPIVTTEQGAKWLACARKAMEWLDQGKSKVGSNRRER